MELWGWVACVFAGQLIGVALCLLPYKAVAQSTVPSGFLPDDGYSSLALAGMWSDLAGPPQAGAGMVRPRGRDAA